MDLFSIIFTDISAMLAAAYVCFKWYLFGTPESGHMEPIRVCLQYGQHDIMELVDEAIHSFKHGFHSRRQQQAVEDFKQWCRTWWGPADGTKPLCKVVDILSDLFFLGNLKHIEVIWVPGLVKSDQADGDLALIGHGSTRIRLDPASGNKRYLIGVMVHECCHSYIQLYACANHWFCNNETRKCGYDGTTGHGAPWILLASAAGIATMDHIGLSFDLGVFRSLLYEIRKGGTLSAADWKLFDDSHEDVGKRRLSQRLSPGDYRELREHCSKRKDWKAVKDIMVARCSHLGFHNW